MLNRIQYSLFLPNTMCSSLHKIFLIGKSTTSNLLLSISKYKFIFDEKSAMHTIKEFGFNNLIIYLIDFDMTLNYSVKVQWMFGKLVFKLFYMYNK